MKERDSAAENQVVTLGEEVMKVMIEELRKNTEAIAGNEVQIGQLAKTVGELLGIKERMEALEKGLVSTKEGLVDVKEVVDRPGIPEKEITGLRVDLRTHAAFFKEPVKKDIHHRHFIGWPIGVIFGLVALMGLSWTLTGIATVKGERYSENDIKWRYAKVIDDLAILRKLDSVEMKYQQNPDQFRSDVLEEEQRIRELGEKYLEEQKAREGIDALNKKGKRY